MKKHLLPHILIILFVFILAPTAHVASYAGALEDAKEEVRKNPDDADAHLNLGLAYYGSGNYKEAIESYRQAIEIDPDWAPYHYNLGLAYLQLNDKGSALEQYEILENLDSELAKELFDEIYRDLISQRVIE